MLKNYLPDFKIRNDVTRKNNMVKPAFVGRQVESFFETHRHIGHIERCIFSLKLNDF
jgi:hypothetical protein